MAELVLALDLDEKEALSLAETLAETVTYYKIGHKLFTSSPGIITRLSGNGRKVFLDLKYHDIPTVVGLAVKEVASGYAPFALTLHTSGGRNMMKAAAEARDSLPEGSRPLLFGVTVLTSMGPEDLNDIGIDLAGKDLSKQVSRLAILARESGLDGVVCSGHEIELIKSACGKDFLTLVPGISSVTPGDTDNRLQGDQKRKMSMVEAAGKGADYIVSGRLVYRSKSPKETAGKINGHLKDI